MRQVPEELQRRLDSGATTLCRCWLIERADGVRLGFTDHDGPLDMEGVTYAADAGMDAGALQSSTGLSVDNAQAVGALTADAITEADVDAGKYDRAEVFHWLVDWTRPDLRVLLFRGRLGEIRRKDSAFEAELRGLAEDLNVAVGRSILRTCDRVLGDAKCGFDLDTPGFSFEAQVGTGSSGTGIVCDLQDGPAEGWFRNGVLTWTTGANAPEQATLRGDQLRSGGRRAFALWQEPRSPVRVGDRFRVTVGCDKRMSTCRDRFSNLLNFRGFPHIPGEDWVTAYPKGGENHDGTSRER